MSAIKVGSPDPEPQNHNTAEVAGIPSRNESESPGADCSEADESSSPTDCSSSDGSSSQEEIVEELREGCTQQLRGPPDVLKGESFPMSTAPGRVSQVSGSGGPGQIVPERTLDQQMILSQVSGPESSRTGPDQGRPLTRGSGPQVGMLGPDQGGCKVSTGLHPFELTTGQMSGESQGCPLLPRSRYVGLAARP